VSPALAQSGPTSSDGDTPVHRVFLPSVSSAISSALGQAQHTDILGTIESERDLRLLLERGGRSSEEIEQVITKYRQLLSSYSPDSPTAVANTDTKQLNCGYGQSATVIFFTGTGYWTGTWYTNYGSFPITQYCQGVCLHDRTLTPWSSWQRIYSHSLVGTSVAHLIGWCF
jgi:hypothetical protein